MLQSHAIVLSHDDTATFADAVSALSNTPLAAPAYIIVGGTQSGEGAVITRDRYSTASRCVRPISTHRVPPTRNREYARDVWYIDVNDGRWFEVETNDDHWRAPDDDRRGVANRLTALFFGFTTLRSVTNLMSATGEWKDWAGPMWV